MAFTDEDLETSDRQGDLEAALEDVRHGLAESSVNLGGLSHLLPDQSEQFRRVWNDLSEKQRLTLLEALHRHEVDSLRLDFNSIYHLGMLDESGEVRRQAIESIVEDDSTWLLEQLLKLVAEDPEAEVRATAADALGAFARRAELGEIATDQLAPIRDTLIETIHRPGERLDVKAAALAAVGYISGDLVSHKIEAGFRDEETRVHALRAMGHSADDVWIETILTQFGEPDDALRLAAATAAGEIGDKAAVPGLTELIDDPSMTVRLAAIAALGEIGGEEARESLVYALEDKREVIRAAAAAAIETLDFFDDPMTL